MGIWTPQKKQYQSWLELNSTSFISLKQGLINVFDQRSARQRDENSRI